MNFDQITGIVRVLAPAAVGWAAGRGWIPPGDATGDIGAAVVALAAAIWSYYSNTTGKTIR